MLPIMLHLIGSLKNAISYRGTQTKYLQQIFAHTHFNGWNLPDQMAQLKETI